MNVFGLFDEDYSFADLFSKLKIINGLNSKTIAFADLYDHKFHFFEPADEVKIKTLKSLFEFPIPNDYIHFLTITNGLALLDDIKILSVDEVIENKEIFYYPNNIMVISQIQAETHICIDLKAKDNLHMYVTEPIGHNKAYSLDCDFKQFLLRFIKSYGAPFWTWGANWEKAISTEEISNDFKPMEYVSIDIIKSK